MHDQNGIQSSLFRDFPVTVAGEKVIRREPVSLYAYVTLAVDER